MKERPIKIYELNELPLEMRKESEFLDGAEFWFDVTWLARLESRGQINIYVFRPHGWQLSYGFGN